MFYVLLFWTSLKDVVLGCERESERQYQRPLADYHHQKRKENNKTGITGCDSFVVAYFQPATSIDRLHSVYVREMLWLVKNGHKSQRVSKYRLYSLAFGLTPLFSHLLEFPSPSLSWKWHRTRNWLNYNSGAFSEVGLTPLLSLFAGSTFQPRLWEEWQATMHTFHRTARISQCVNGRWARFWFTESFSLPNKIQHCGLAGLICILQYSDVVIWPH